MATNRLLMVMCAVLLALRVWAFEAGGVAYEVTTGTNVNVVEHWPPYEGDIVVPATVRHGGVTYQVTGIARRAFADAVQLTSVTLAEGLTTIGADAFKGCVMLREISVPNSVTEIGSRAFCDCEALQQITLGTGFTTVPYAMCMNCFSLASVVVPDQVTTIGSYAFANTPIASLTIGRNVVNVESNAFLGCKWVRQVNIFDMGHWCGYDFATYELNPLYYARTMTLDGEQLTSVVVPEGIEELKPYTFANSNMTSITLPQSLKTFHQLSCYRADFASLDLPDGVTTIVPAGLVTAGLSSLRSISIGSGVRVLQSTTFNNAVYVSQITLSEGLEEIYDNVFSNSGITELVLPNSVTIVSNAFIGCTKLKKLFFGKGLKHLDNYSFRGCSNLEEIHIPVRDPAQIVLGGTGQFEYTIASRNDGVDKTKCVIYVPTGSARSYRNHPFWGQFTHIEEENIAVPGDADGNGIIDIDDVNLIINAMIHKPLSDNFNFENADFNGDGVIDIDDLNAVINKMVGKG